MKSFINSCLSYIKEKKTPSLQFVSPDILTTLSNENITRRLERFYSPYQYNPIEQLNKKDAVAFLCELKKLIQYAKEFQLTIQSSFMQEDLIDKIDCIYSHILIINFLNECEVKRQEIGEALNLKNGTLKTYLSHSGITKIIKEFPLTEGNCKICGNECSFAAIKAIAKELKTHVNPDLLNLIRKHNALSSYSKILSILVIGKFPFSTIAKHLKRKEKTLEIQLLRINDRIRQIAIKNYLTKQDMEDSFKKALINLSKTSQNKWSFIISQGDKVKEKELMNSLIY